MDAGTGRPGTPVVDGHVHAFPPEIVRNREPWLGRDEWFSALYTNPRATLVDIDGMIAVMDEAGVEHAVLCGFPWADPALCHEHNAYHASEVRRFPGRLSWLGIVAPASLGAAAEALWCLEHGAAGIGEMNADAQGFDWRDLTLLHELVSVCVEHESPLLLHASEAVGHAYPGKGSATPEKLLEFIGHFRQLCIVAAHWGGGLPFHELMPEVEQVTANVVYDCAASTYLYRPKIFRAVLDIVGQERVIFGSDYPVLTMGRFLERVRALPWRDDSEVTAVLGGNARRVFRVDERMGRHR